MLSSFSRAVNQNKCLALQVRAVASQRLKESEMFIGDFNSGKQALCMGVERIWASLSVHQFGLHVAHYFKNGALIAVLILQECQALAPSKNTISVAQNTVIACSVLEHYANLQYFFVRGTE